MKLVILIALTSASGTSAIRHRHIRYIIRGNRKYIYEFHKLGKNRRYGKTVLNLEYRGSSED